MRGGWRPLSRRTSLFLVGGGSGFPILLGMTAREIRGISRGWCEGGRVGKDGNDLFIPHPLAPSPNRKIIGWCCINCLERGK